MNKNLPSFSLSQKKTIRFVDFFGLMRYLLIAKKPNTVLGELNEDLHTDFARIKLAEEFN